MERKIYYRERYKYQLAKDYVIQTKEGGREILTAGADA